MWLHDACLSLPAARTGTMTGLAELHTGQAWLQRGCPCRVHTDNPNVIARASTLQVRSHVDDATAQGARVVIGGSSAPELKEPYNKGYFFQPTVIADATPSMKIYREETFGPAMPLFKFRYDEEAIKLANDTEYGLAAYFFTKVQRYHDAGGCALL